MNPLQIGARDPFLLQLAHHIQHLALAADHGDITRRGRDRQLQHAHVVAMPARHDDHIAGFVDREPRKNLFVLGGMHIRGFGKSLAVGKGLAIVDDDRSESGQCRNLREALRDMSRAKDVSGRHGRDRLDENVKLPAADQAVVVCGVLP